MASQVLETVTRAKYFGVDISNNLSWNTLVDRQVTASANSQMVPQSPENCLPDPCMSLNEVLFSYLGPPH